MEAPPRPVAQVVRENRQPPAPRAAARGLLAGYDLQKSYGGRRVVNGVSVNVARGEAVGLLGPNGAGKTTVFYMVIGLVKADAGRIELGRPRGDAASDVSSGAAPASGISRRKPRSFAG